jgi:hypothetical protein
VFNLTVDCCFMIKATGRNKKGGSKELFATRASSHDPAFEDDDEEFDDMELMHNELLENNFPSTEKNYSTCSMGTSTGTDLKKNSYSTASSTGDDCGDVAPAKRQKISYAGNSGAVRSMVEQSALALEDNPEFFSSSLSMVLPMLGYCWKDHKLRKLITVVVNLPSGLIHRGNKCLAGLVLPKLVEGNKKILLQVQWPDCLLNDSVLAQGVKECDTCPTGSMSSGFCLQGFREAVARMSKAMVSIGTDVLISLPYEVDGILEFLPVCCGDTGGYNVIIILKVKMQETHETSYSMDFKVVREKDLSKTSSSYY